MVKIKYLDDFKERILRGETDGAQPEEVRTVVPSIVAPNERFSLRIAVVDSCGYPASTVGGTEVKISCPEGELEPIAVKLDSNRLPLVEISDLFLPGEGIFRITAEIGGRMFPSNPVWSTEATRQRLYWGDPHIHTVLSDCHPDRCRSLNFGYTAARHLSCLDWAAAADHVSNGRCDFSKWKDQRLTCDQFNAPFEFVSLPAYEASLRGGAGGDNNVYLSAPVPNFVDEFENGNVRTLVERLERETAGEAADFFVVPHHTTRTGKHGEISPDIYPGESRMPAIEIHSKWGSSEYRGNPQPLKEVHPGPAYAVDLLNKGYRLGFIGGTDTHVTLTFCSPELESDHIDRPPGLTAVYAPRLTRKEIFAGIRERRCYAACGERILLQVKCGDRKPGDVGVFDGEPRRFEVMAAARSRLATIEIIRNGRVLHSQKIEGWFKALSYTDESDLGEFLLEDTAGNHFAYYYIRVTTTSQATAWSSPIWFETGDKEAKP